MKYYESFESRPIFETVDDMLKWADLYNLTAKTLESELAEAGLTPLLIQELITVRHFTHLFEYLLHFLSFFLFPFGFTRNGCMVCFLNYIQMEIVVCVCEVWMVWICSLLYALAYRRIMKWA